MPDVKQFPNLEALSQAAAAIFAEAVTAAAAEGRNAFVAVSGGGTPKRLYEILADEPWRDRVPWDRLQLFWVDERPVPPENPESNYRLVDRSLLRHAPIPGNNIHPVPVAEGTPDQAAASYEATLQELLPRAADGWPRFDLVLLGMGDDGHTASLFPGSPGLQEREHWAIANPVEKLGVKRITLTFPVINHAARVVFLVSGTLKAAILTRVLGPQRNVALLPSQGVQPVEGEPTWLLDAGAAGR